MDGNRIAGTAQTDLLTLWLHHSSSNESKPYYVGRVEFTPGETDTYYIVAGAHTGYTGTYDVSVGDVKRVWSTTMTVGAHTTVPGLFGWDGAGVSFPNAALTDADFVYGNETYEIVDILISTGGGGFTVEFDATNSGSISDAAARSVMTLYVDGTAFVLGDATYELKSDGEHGLTWTNSGLTWAAGDTVGLEMWVTE